MFPVVVVGIRLEVVVGAGGVVVGGGGGGAGWMYCGCDGGEVVAAWR